MPGPFHSSLTTASEIWFMKVNDDDGVFSAFSEMVDHGFSDGAVSASQSSFSFAETPIFYMYNLHVQNLIVKNFLFYTR